MIAEMTETRLRGYYCSECWFYNEAASPGRGAHGGDCCTAPHNNKGVAQQETERYIRDFWERGCKKEDAKAVHVLAPGAKACLAFKPFEEGLPNHKEEMR